MIHEIRTYMIHPGKMAEFEDFFAEALPYREKYSKLTACWHTEVGPLNQIVHMWTYDDLAHRTKVREEANKDPHWPPKDLHLIQNMESNILIPAPFMKPIEPGHHGNIFEMRSYACKPGSIPQVMKRWEEKIALREKHSPCFACGYTFIGGLNRLIHIWPYESMEERARIREESIKSGDWPPNSQEFYQTLENKILVPSHFSHVN